MIKRFLYALICASMFLVILVAFDEAEYAEKQQYSSAGTRVGWVMEIPEQASVDDPSVFWPILEDAAIQSGVNVFRKADGFDSNNEPFISYYALLTSEKTKFFDSFRLRDGRLPSVSETQEGSSYLSSVASDDQNQVGVIDDIGRNDHYFVYGLEEVFDGYKAAGNYFIEASNIEAEQVFYNLFVSKFEEVGLSIEFNEIHDETYDNDVVWGYQEGFAQSAVWFAILAAIIMIFYRQISESKKTAVLLLYGNTSLCAWYLISGRVLITITLSCITCAALIVFLMPGTTIWLVLSTLGKLIGVAGLFVISSLLTLVLIKNINIQEALKNRKDTLILAVGNLFIKGILCLVLVYMGAVTFSQYQSAQKEREFWGDWQSTSQYGVFYPYKVGADGSASVFAARERIVFDLYPEFNANGSLFVFAGDYAYYAIGDGRAGYRSLTVNPNYLEVYPIQDADGNEVIVSEDEADWVLLVPETFKSEENQIVEFFATQRMGGDESVWELDERLFGRTVENPQPNQKTKIIWIASDQRVFSFSPEVNQDDGNQVTNPIVEVMTIGNSSGMDREVCVMGGVADALKVKLDAGGSAQTYERYLPLLQEHGLDDNLQQIVTMDELVFSLLQGIDESVMQYAFQMVLIFLLFLALVLQSVPLIFELDSRRTAVRKLYGYSFVSRNQFFFRVFASNWLALILVTLAFNSVLGWPWGGYGRQDVLVLLAVACVFVVLEAVLSAFVLSIVERRRVADVLKGGF